MCTLLFFMVTIVIIQRRGYIHGSSSARRWSLAWYGKIGSCRAGGFREEMVEKLQSWQRWGGARKCALGAPTVATQAKPRGPCWVLHRSPALGVQPRHDKQQGFRTRYSYTFRAFDPERFFGICQVLHLENVNQDTEAFCDNFSELLHERKYQEYFQN